MHESATAMRRRRREEARGRSSRAAAQPSHSSSSNGRRSEADQPVAGARRQRHRRRVLALPAGGRGRPRRADRPRCGRRARRRPGPCAMPAPRAAARNGTSTIALMRPGCAVITTMRSPSVTASSTLWVMKTTVFLSSSQMRSSSSCSNVRFCSSSAENGSSISSTSGSVAKARAIDDALLHAARQLVRIAVGERRQAGAVEVVADHLADLRPGRAAHAQPVGGVVPHRHPRERSNSPWNTIALSGFAGSSAAIVARPALALSSPARMRSSVVLPQPDGPTIVQKLPRAMSSEMPSSAVNGRRGSRSACQAGDRDLRRGRRGPGRGKALSGRLAIL